MPIRRILFHVRRRRLAFAVAAGTLTTVLSTVYDNIPTSLRHTSLAVLALLSGALFLLTDTGGVASDIDDHTPRANVPTTQPKRRRGVWTLWQALRRRRGRNTQPLRPLLVGRDKELSDLLALHRQARERRRPTRRRGGPHTAELLERQSIGAVVTFIHGKPGVGKSALAQALVAELAPDYKAGQIFVDLGTAGTARTPAEALKAMLLALGWSESEMPESQLGRAVLFRSLTAKRPLLFVFDAARNADQVRQILPNDPANAVIVTSRRDLTTDPDFQLKPSYVLDVPAENEALEIFRAISRSGIHERPECAAQIVERCGRMPVAIRSAAERVGEEGNDICGVARYLAEPNTRLSRLERPGRPVRAMIQTEFSRLLPAERDALMHLTLLPAASFSPWILMPLLDVDFTQAEALADRLVTAQMIETTTQYPSNLARFTIHPLIRLYAHHEAESIDADSREQAMTRVDKVYQTIIAAVLPILDPTAPPAATAMQPVETQMLPDRIAKQPRLWIYAEHLNLVRQIEVAYERGDHARCWRLGAMLDGAVPRDVDVNASLRAYELAQKAACAEGSDQGRARVHVATAKFLAATGRYFEAESEFNNALDLVTQLDGADDSCDLIKRMTLGWTLVWARAHHDAAEQLNASLRLAAGSDTARIADILIALNEHVAAPSWIHDALQDDELDDFGAFCAHLALADADRAVAEWDGAFRHLDIAMKLAGDDLGRIATVQVMTGEFHLHHAGDAGARPEQTDLAIQWSSAAIISYRRMKHHPGQLRARCLQARAFIAAGLREEAEKLAFELASEASPVDDVADPMLRPVVARVKQAQGEVLWQSPQHERARAMLIEAAATFRLIADAMSESEVTETLRQPMVIPRQRVGS